MRRLVFLLSLAACSPDGSNIARAPYILQSVPLRHDFGSAAVGGLATASIVLQNTGSGAATVDSIAVLGEGGGAFQMIEGWVGEIDGRGEATVVVTFQPTAEGLFEDRLVVTIEADPVDIFDVELRGLGVEDGLRAWPAVLDFGPVATGASAEQAVYLENQTDNPIVVSGPRFTGDDTGFSLLPGDGVGQPPWTLAPGVTSAFAVRLDAASEDAADATLRFLDDEGQPWSTRIDLVANDCVGSTAGAWDADGDGWSRCAGDCDDEDATVFPGAIEEIDDLDDDCDGLADEGTDAYDDDGDGQNEYAGDCHDGDATIWEGAEEIPDGQDNDCDGEVDEGTALVDTDGDGWTESAGDCAPTNPLAYPGATELPDGVDNNCDGSVDEGTSVADDDGDGYCENPVSCNGTALPGDCNDADEDANPLASEVVNGRDDDCDGIVDNGTGAVDSDGDGWAPDGGDCDDTDPAIYPGAPEHVDGADQDCDGALDEGTSAVDDDGDGFSEAAGDCNDGDDRVLPGGAEDRAAAVPGDGDGIDNDCDGQVDEGTAWFDDDGDGFTEAGGDCDDANIYFSPGQPDPPGDSLDRNCDGAD